MGRLSIERRVKRATNAIRELRLSSMTKADQTRLSYVSDGLEALDEEQAKMKAALDLAFDENQDTGRVTEDIIREALANEGFTWARPQPSEPQEKKR